MKVLTHTICQLLTALCTIICYTAVYLIGKNMLNAVHVAQLTPACFLICLLLGLCSAVCNIKSAYRWAQGTIKRQLGMPLSYTVRNSSLVDRSHLFTGIDTIEDQRIIVYPAVEEWVYDIENVYFLQD